MDSILIDTDVLLDFFFDRRPHSENAAIILSLCETGKINGFITPVICSNLYYILRQNASHKKVIDKLAQLLKIVDVLVMDRNVVLQAIESGFIHFEDALQNYAAIGSGIIDVIITRNIKDYIKSEVAVFTPDEYIKSRMKSGTII